MECYWSKDNGENGINNENNKKGSLIPFIYLMGFEEWEKTHNGHILQESLLQVAFMLKLFS